MAAGTNIPPPQTRDGSSCNPLELCIFSDPERIDSKFICEDVNHPAYKQPFCVSIPALSNPNL